MAATTVAYKAFGVSVGTYSSPPVLSGDRVIFAEPPIVNPQWRWDIESKIRGAEVVDVVGDLKVDKYLSDRTIGDVNAVSQFLGLLEST